MSDGSKRSYQSVPVGNSSTGQYAVRGRLVSVQKYIVGGTVKGKEDEI